MKKFFQFFAILSIGTLFIFSSCKDDAVGPQVSEFDTLVSYMAQNNLDFGDYLSGWVVPGSKLTVDENDYSVADYFVIDIRSQEDFNAGHIKNAVNTTLGNILTTAEQANGDPILVVCYTGQTAGRAVGALRLVGYNAQSLKWGMSGWNSNFAGKWNANAGDYTHTNWVTSGDPLPNGNFEAPEIRTGFSDGADILRARVEYMLTKTDWGIKKDALLDNSSNYFVNNKWSESSWSAYGHVKDAYRLDEQISLGGLKYFNPDATIVNYCYTGQTSAISNMWFDVLGYDTKSLLFGANGIVHTQLQNGSAAGKSWKGAGSASEMNFGYWDSEGNFYAPGE